MATLAFDKVLYTVAVPGSPLPKALLTDVKGEVTAGHVLAILGPSGAGKTTLLNTLTLQSGGGSPSGFVRVNGEPLTTKLYNVLCAYVEQFDTLWASLTVREHLFYAMACFKPALDAAARDAAIDQLIQRVGLQDFQDVRGGNEITRGLSSGNKRRLSVALALVKSPAILFLDEPTSGVDSASAMRMMTFLKNIAAEINIAVACTIHQPPASVFADFDNTMILSMGRVAYFGKAHLLGEYLGTIGYPPGAETNVAEYVLDLVNKDFTPVAGVRAVLDKWAERNGAAYGVEEPSSTTAGEQRSATRLEQPKTASFATQLAVLTNRSVLVAAREPLAYLLRLAANFGTNIFFGIIYIKTRDMEQGQVASRTYFLMFCMGIPMQFVLISNFVYHYQWLSLKREVKDGMYNPAAAAIASWIVQVPMMFVLAVVSLTPPFLLGALSFEGFPMALVFYALCFWAFEGMAQAFAVLPNVIFALFGYLSAYFTAFLFCGMFVDPVDVVWPLRAFCYVLPLGWALQSYIYSCYHYISHHSGTLPCMPGEALPEGGVCSDQGFYCWSESDPTGAVCFGETGDQILDSLSVQFAIFGPDAHYARNAGFIVAFGLVCRLGYVGIIHALTQLYGGQEPAPPAESYSVMIEEEGAESGAGGDGQAVAIKVGEETDAAPEGSKVVWAGSGGEPQQVTFAFRDIGYSIPQGKGAASQVLQHVSATVKNGELLGIVGSSGAGKTILLDTLTFSKGPGTPTGKILLNGTPMTRRMFHDSAIYVPREDNLWPTLTAREHIDFAFSLFKPQLDAQSRERAVDQLLAVTGMASAQDTKAGGFLFKGLSGGQRRRLALAVALVKDPSVIILDEPTSGLDSAAAAAVMKLLSTIATRSSAAVLCTIHQPSAEVFSGFHKVLVLSEGRTAFCGERTAIAPYFESIAMPLSKGANPAEAVLDLVSKDTSSAEAVAKVLDKWAESGASAAAAGEEPSATGDAVALGRAAAARSAFGATLHVFRRQLELALNDPLQYTGRLVVCPFLISFFGLVYVASHEANQKQVPFRLFYMWWVIALSNCLSITTVIGTNRDIRSVVYEIRAGMYPSASYVLSTSLVQIPMLVILSFAISVCAFAIGGWPFEGYISFVFQFATSLFAFESLAQLLAVLFVNPVFGMLCHLIMWSSSILFCGLVFRGEDVVWPFRAFYYALPLKWGMNGVGYDIFISQDFSGAVLCEPGSIIETAGGAESVCTDAGFYCPETATSFGCWGRTGTQVLDTMHMTYESLNSKDERLLDFAVQLAMVVALKLGFAFTLQRTVSASDTPH